MVFSLFKSSAVSVNIFRDKLWESTGKRASSSVNYTIFGTGKLIQV